MDRRRFISLATGLAPLAYLSSLELAWGQTEKPQPVYSPLVSLTFDDGLAGVHGHAFPILQEHKVKGVAGVITSRIDSDNNDYMGWSQIRDLASAGWEIASHSVNHVRPIHIPLLYSQEIIKGWKSDTHTSSIFQTHYEYEIITGLFENDRPLSPAETIKDLNTRPGAYYFDRIIEELHVRPYIYPESPSMLNIRTVSYEREMEQSKNDLSKRGINASTFVAPYNYWTDAVKELSKRYYNLAVVGKDENNQPSAFDNFAIKRFMVHKNDSVSHLMRIVKENNANTNGWTIFCLHGIGDNVGWEPWTSDKLNKFILLLKQDGVGIVTVSEGARQMQARAASI